MVGERKMTLETRGRGSGIRAWRRRAKPRQAAAIDRNRSRRFPVVAFIKGPETVDDVDDVDDGLAYLSTGLLLAAAIVTSVAGLVRGLASQGSSKAADLLTGPGPAGPRPAFRSHRRLATAVVSSADGSRGPADRRRCRRDADRRGLRPPDKTVNVLVADEDGKVASGPVQSKAVTIDANGRAAFRHPVAVNLVDGHSAAGFFPSNAVKPSMEFQQSAPYRQPSAGPSGRACCPLILE